MSLSAQEKQAIKALFPAGPFHIYYATVAKLYLTFTENNWSDTGLVGAVVFLKDNGKNGSFFLRFVTLPVRQPTNYFDVQSFFAILIFLMDDVGNAYCLGTGNVRWFHLLAG